MKKLLMTMLLMPLMALADTEIVNGIEWTFAISGGRATVGKLYNRAVPVETVGAIEIPSSLGGCSVTSIGTEAFRDCTNLTSVTIPSSVTSIGDQAFYNCSGLTSVTISEGVTHIGNSAFSDCIGLAAVTIPSSVTSIGNRAFYYCKSLGSLELEEGVKSIGPAAFSWCTSLKEIVIPSTVENIGWVGEDQAGAFCNCKSLTSVVIKDGVKKSIYHYAFAWCENLETVSIPSSVEKIYEYAFGECKKLEKIVVPDGVKSIGDVAFAYCTSLAEVRLLGNFDRVGNSFVGCTGVRKLAYSGMGGTLSYMMPDSYANITSVTISAGSTNIVAEAFAECSKISSIEIPGSVVKIGDSAFKNCYSLTSVTIQPGVAEIGSCAFYGCQYIRFLDIPTSVTKIGSGAFYDIKETIGHSSCQFLGVPYQFAALFPEASEFVVKVPQGEETISEINNSKAITAIVIPPSVKKIEESFGQCVKLRDVYISDMESWCKIEFARGNPLSQAEGFYLNGVLVDDVAIPDSVKSISPKAFSGWCGRSVLINDNVTNIGNYAFCDCSNLTHVAMSDNVRTIGAHAFSGCKSLKDMSIPHGILSIERETFDGCCGLEKIDLPVTLKSIGDEAFFGCGKLSEISLPSALTNIGWSAFEDCSQIRKVDIPSGVKVIPYNAFAGCVGLLRVDIQSGVTTIINDAFNGCRGVESVSIPKTVSNISPWSFYKCANLLVIDVVDDNLLYKSINGILFTKDVSEMVICPEGRKSMTMPSSVTRLSAMYDSSLRLREHRGEWSVDTVYVEQGDALRVRDLIVKSCLNTDVYYVEGVEPYVPPAVSFFVVTFDAAGGMAGWTKNEVVKGAVVGALPTATWEGYEFLGWFTAAVGGTQVSAATVVTEDVTFYAQWQKIGGEEDPASPPVEPPVDPTTPTNVPPTVVDEAEAHVDAEKGEVAPYAEAAVVYDGFLYAGEKVIGSVQVKVAKMKDGEAKVTATVQMAGQSKKLSFKSGVADATGAVTEMMDKDGNKLVVTVGVNGLGGEFRRSRSDTLYRIDGARNVFSGRSAADKTAAGEAARLYQGVYNVAFDDGTLSVSVDKKGKAKIAGTVEGNKVSATSQLVVGDSAAVVPVVIVKKVNLSFCLWVMADGTVEARGIEGAIAGKAGALKAGAKFGVDGAARVRALSGLYGEYLPNEIDVSASGTKWIVAGGAKAGKVAFVKGGNTVDESKLGTNPSGLKLAYKQKEGTFKGSFKVYNLESNGKIRAYTANVTGVMIGTKGYGTATVKKPFVSFSIAIE